MNIVRCSGFCSFLAKIVSGKFVPAGTTRTITAQQYNMLQKRLVEKQCRQPQGQQLVQPSQIQQGKQGVQTAVRKIATAAPQKQLPAGSKVDQQRLTQTMTVAFPAQQAIQHKRLYAQQQQLQQILQQKQPAKPRQVQQVQQKPTSQATSAQPTEQTTKQQQEKQSVPQQVTTQQQLVTTQQIAVQQQQAVTQQQQTTTTQQIKQAKFPSGQQVTSSMLFVEMVCQLESCYRTANSSIQLYRFRFPLVVILDQLEMILTGPLGRTV